MIEDVVSDRQFARAKAAPGIESPARPTMQPGEHLGEQFAGLIAGSPEVKARRPNYIGGRSLHEYSTSPGSSSE